MAATASIIIEVQDGQATAALKGINAEAAKIGPTLQPVQRISEQTFNNIEHGALKARESAALLGEEFGVKVPRALRGVIAESRLLGPIFTAAFSGLAILGFIEIVKQAAEQLTGFGEALKSIEKQNAALMQSVHDANKILEGPQNLEQITKKLGDAQKRVLELNEALGLTGDLFGDSVRIGLAKKFSVAGGIMVEELDKQKTLVEELSVEHAKLVDEQRRTEPIEILKQQNAARLAGLECIAKIDAAERDQTAVLRAEIAASIRHEAVGQAEITAIHAEAHAKKIAYMRAEEDATRHLAHEALLTYVKGSAEIREKEQDSIDEQKVLLDRKFIQYETYLERTRSITIIADNQLAELARKNAEDVMQAQQQAAVDMLPPWQRAYAQISLDTQRRLREIQQALKETRITAEDAAKLSAAAWQEEFAKTRDKLASDLESAFDEITSGGIGKYFLKQFKHLVFEMVAAWILGMQQMKGASQQTMGQGGGILGAIFGSLGLGGIFGGGGGASGGPGGTPPFLGGLLGGGDSASLADSGSASGSVTAGGGILGALGLSAGGGLGAPGTTLPSGAGPGGAAAGPIGQLLGKLFSHGIGPISGSVLATLGIGLFADSFGKGGFLRGFEGAAGGALTGFTIGGPIGALIGGIIGFFAGFFQHSTRKARLAIEAQIKDQAQKAEDAYNTFQADAPSSLAALEVLRTQGVDALKKAGVKDIKRSRVGHVDQWIDKAEKEINATQAERDRRAAIVFGPAEFRTGGFVGPGLGGPMPSWFAGSAMRFAGGGAVPAILHEGEYVMRPEAVSRIGAGNLHHMNYGGGAGDTYITNVNLRAWDGKSVEEWLSSGGMDKIVYAHRRGVREGRY